MNMLERKLYGLRKELVAKRYLIELGFEILWHDPLKNCSFDMVVKKDSITYLVEVKSSIHSILHSNFSISERKLSKLLYLNKPILLVFVNGLDTIFVSKFNCISNNIKKENIDLHIKFTKIGKMVGCEVEVLEQIERENKNE